MTESETAPQNQESSVDQAKPADKRKQSIWRQLLILLSIPIAVLVIGAIASWWRPVSLLLLCPVVKVMGTPQMAEPLAKRAVELYLRNEGLNSKYTMWAVWNLAETYREQDKFREAERLYRGLSDYNAKHQGDQAVMPYQTLVGLAKSLRGLGREGDAQAVEVKMKEEAKKARSR